MFGWILLLFITGYGIGCLHGSLAAQVLSGVNVKKEGVKNSGASNTAIVLGWKYGLLVAFIDISNGFAAVAACRFLLELAAFSPDIIWTLLFVTGTGVVFGHNFPFYMNFDDGKGTASVIGGHAGTRLEAGTGRTGAADWRFACYKLSGHWRTGPLCRLFRYCFWPLRWSMAIADSQCFICYGDMEA